MDFSTFLSQFLRFCIVLFQRKLFRWWNGRRYKSGNKRTTKTNLQHCNSKANEASLNVIFKFFKVHLIFHCWMFDGNNFRIDDTSKTENEWNTFSVMLWLWHELQQVWRLLEVTTTSLVEAHSSNTNCLPLIFVMTWKQSCNHSTNPWLSFEPRIYFCIMAPGFVIFHYHNNNNNFSYGKSSTFHETPSFALVL